MDTQTCLGVDKSGRYGQRYHWNNRCMPNTLLGFILILVDQSVFAYFILNMIIKVSNWSYHYVLVLMISVIWYSHVNLLLIMYREHWNAFFNWITFTVSAVCHFSIGLLGFTDQTGERPMKLSSISCYGPMKYTVSMKYTLLDRWNKIIVRQTVSVINMYEKYMNYYPLFRVRSWHNGVRCMSFCILKMTISSLGVNELSDLTNVACWWGYWVWGSWLPCQGYIQPQSLYPWWMEHRWAGVDTQQDGEE